MLIDCAGSKRDTMNCYRLYLYIYIESIFKKHNLLKIEDLYKVKMVEIHLNLIKGHLPSKFDISCQKLSFVNKCYEIRNSIYVFSL